MNFSPVAVGVHFPKNTSLFANIETLACDLIYSSIVCPTDFGSKMHRARPHCRDKLFMSTETIVSLFAQLENYKSCQHKFV